MHRYLGFIAAAFAVLGFLAFAAMFWGMANNGGIAVLGMQMWGVIASVAAVVLGFVARLMAKNQPVRISRASDFGMGLGLGNLLALLIAMLFFG